jgi:tryptophan synthase alpha chain
LPGFRAKHPDVPVGILVVARDGLMRNAAEAGADSLLITDVPAR